MVLQNNSNWCCCLYYFSGVWPSNLSKLSAQWSLRQETKAKAKDLTPEQQEKILKRIVICGLIGGILVLLQYIVYLINNWGLIVSLFPNSAASQIFSGSNLEGVEGLGKTPSSGWWLGIGIMGYQGHDGVCRTCGSTRCQAIRGKIRMNSLPQLLRFAGLV